MRSKRTAVVLCHHQRFCVFALALRPDGLGRCHEATPCIAYSPHPMGPLGQLQANVCLDRRTDADEKKGPRTELLASLKIENDARNEVEETPAAHGSGQSRHGGKRGQLFLPPAAQGHCLLFVLRQLRCLKVRWFAKLSKLHCALKQELTLDVPSVLAKHPYYWRRRVAFN